jgi:DNA repair exonuclease SbcCD ATPase subunit
MNETGSPYQHMTRLELEHQLAEARATIDAREKHIGELLIEIEDYINKAETAEAVLAALKKEAEQLRGWKESQLEVEATWNPQHVAKALGIPLGESIRPQILPRIADLKREIEGLGNRLRPVEEVYRQYKDNFSKIQALSGGSYTAHTLWQAIKKAGGEGME